MKKVITRFAPSPTGLLHIGNIRTALYSWLYSKNKNGKFILRFEDTDKNRSETKFTQSILDIMSWLNIDYDIGPIYQSRRLLKYKEIAKKLVLEKKAYWCECSKDRLNSLRINQIINKEKPKYDGYCRNKNLSEKNGTFQVIRFKNPKVGTVTIPDKVYGNIEVKNKELDDFILIKSDGYPTYNFSTSIDDWEMNVTHVIRGNDHISNTPKQINLLHALQASIPIFVHLPMILGKNGKCLSKRDKSINIVYLKEQGFLPSAILNYLLCLGWSYDNQEIFSIHDMIKYFSFNNINKQSSKFDFDKLCWFNKYYLRNESPNKISTLLLEFFKKNNVDHTKGPKLTDLVKVQSIRYKTLLDIFIESKYFYEKNIIYNENIIKKYFTNKAKQLIEILYNRLITIKIWEKYLIKDCMNTVLKENNISIIDISKTLRAVLTGKEHSPSIDIVIFLLGKNRFAYRIKQWIIKMDNNIY